jgi:hypothetical protein
MTILLVDILLVTVNNYFIGGYFRLNYHRILIAIGGYSIISHHNYFI